MGDGYRKGSNTGPASHTSHASSIDRPRPLTSGNNRFFANKNGQKVAPIVTRFRSQTTASPQVTSPRRLPPLQPTGLSVSHSSPNNGPSSLPDSGPGLSMRQGLGHSSTAIAGRSDPAQDASPATPLAALP
ncbi:hypothetical protein CBOM_04579 [Ceraceosorus bombacis]|uniref:Uncharacterized protein n=1 Tax=Ceraceosorus bombacis TaxID=401625 RepID=A0A0P1BQM6_9BASI|nr:hypothetical protein CBOM_04579 [Ceraceosorus bombacis]